MSGVKEFYLTKASICPKCGGVLIHRKQGIPFKCETCSLVMDYIDYVRFALLKMHKQEIVKIFEKCYYEVNK